MNVYIVRDAVEIGHYPRSELEAMAQRGELQPTDYYWHEGMEKWALLPELLGLQAWESSLPAVAADASPTASPAPAPISSPGSAAARIVPRVFAYLKNSIGRMPRAVIVAAIGGAFIVVSLIAIGLTKCRNTETRLSPTVSASPEPASDPALKRKAFAELKRKIDMLPITPSPPRNATYYDFSVNMIPSGSPFFPWSATIHGGENIIDPDTQATIRRTDFVLTVEYRNGEWTYKDYRATETDATNGAPRQIFDDEKTPVPPDIVGILGLKRNP